MAIDLAVILFILTPPVSVTDTLIVALFVPAWGFYFVDGDAGYAGSVIVTSAQMLLTVPLLRLWNASGRCQCMRDLWHDFDLRVGHAP